MVFLKYFSHSVLKITLVITGGGGGGEKGGREEKGGTGEKRRGGKGGIGEMEMRKEELTLRSNLQTVA